MKSLYFDKQGQPIDFARLCELMHDRGYGVVGLTHLGGGEGYVSTVWLGLDHPDYGGPPLVFESMKFPEREPCERYSTLEEAQAGHAAMVAQLTEVAK